MRCWRGRPGEYLTDISQLPGRADAVVMPSSADEVAAVSRGATSATSRSPRAAAAPALAGGATADGGIVLALDRLDKIRSFEPELWRIHVEAGVTTGRLQETVRDSGLMFAPDPGAPEQSQVGGNIATNAGGPHAFKYGVVGEWVTGLEAAIPPGELVTIGGAIRKDVAGYDLKRLLIGSEGTLGIVTAAWLKLLPAPEAVLPVAIFYPGRPRGARRCSRSSAAGSSRRRSSCSTARRSPAVARPSPAGCPRAPGSC